MPPGGEAYGIVVHKYGSAAKKSLKGKLEVVWLVKGNGGEGKWKVKHIDAKKKAGLNARLGEYAEADENITFAFVEAQQDDITVQEAKAGAVKVMPHLPQSKFHLAYGEEE